MGRRPVSIRGQLIVPVASAVLVAAAFMDAGPAAAQAPSPEPTLVAGPEASASVSASGAPLASTPEGTWVVAGFDAWGTGLVEPRPGSRLTVSLLPAGRLEGETGCGTYVGGYTVDGERVRLGVVSRGVEPCGRRAEDEAFELTQALGLATSWAASATGLELRDDGGLVRIVLLPEASTSSGLAGDWEVEVLANRSGVLAAPLEGTTTSLSFGAGGQARGETGCRAFEAGYTVEADRLVIAPIAAIGLPCQGPLRRQDRRMLGILDETVEWRRDERRLRLVGADGEVLLEATAAAAAHPAAGGSPAPSSSATDPEAPLPSPAPGA